MVPMMKTSTIAQLCSWNTQRASGTSHGRQRPRAIGTPIASSISSTLAGITTMKAATSTATVGKPFSHRARGVCGRVITLSTPLEAKDRNGNAQARPSATSAAME